EPGATSALPPLWRHPLRRHHHDRGRMGARLPPRRARGRRGQADDHRAEEQPAPRRPQGLRFSHGAAAHRSVQEGRAGQPAGPGEETEVTRLVSQWGGATVAYRKGLTDAPAYRRNHEEVAEGREGGIVFAEGLSPVEAVPEEHGAVKAVRFALQKQVEGKWR